MNNQVTGEGEATALFLSIYFLVYSAFSSTFFSLTSLNFSFLFTNVWDSDHKYIHIKTCSWFLTLLHLRTRVKVKFEVWMALLSFAYLSPILLFIWIWARKWDKNTRYTHVVWIGKPSSFLLQDLLEIPSVIFRLFRFQVESVEELPITFFPNFF